MCQARTMSVTSRLWMPAAAGTEDRVVGSPAAGIEFQVTVDSTQSVKRLEAVIETGSAPSPATRFR